MQNPLLFIFLAVFAFVSCTNERKKIAAISSIEFINIDSITIPKEDSVMYKSILPYKSELDSTMNQQIGFSENAIERNLPNGELNNLVADIVFLYKNYKGMKADFCLLNYGGLRYDLPKGKITRNDIFQLMPFDNKLVLAKIKGNLIDSIAKNIISNGGHPIAGMSLIISKNQDYSIKINGKAFDKNKSYIVLTSDYLAYGGDNMSFFKYADTIVETKIMVRDALLQTLIESNKVNKSIIPNNEKRILYEN